jgi:hypothetical protein
VSSLQDFLNVNPVDNVTDDVVISDRFKDKDGNVMKFKIKAMTNDEFEEIRKAAASISTKKGKRSISFDTKRFNELVVINNTIDPNFKDAESIKKLGCITPEQYLNKVLLAGEIVELSQQIQTLSGFELEIDELVEEAKN